MRRRIETALLVLVAIVLYDRRVTRMVNEAEDYTAWWADHR